MINKNLKNFLVCNLIRNIFDVYDSSDIDIKTKEVVCNLINVINKEYFNNYKPHNISPSLIEQVGSFFSSVIYSNKKIRKFINKYNNYNEYTKYVVKSGYASKDFMIIIENLDNIALLRKTTDLLASYNNSNSDFLDDSMRNLNIKHASYLLILYVIYISNMMFNVSNFTYSKNNYDSVSLYNDIVYMDEVQKFVKNKMKIVAGDAETQDDIGKYNALSNIKTKDDYIKKTIENNETINSSYIDVLNLFFDKMKELGISKEDQMFTIIQWGNNISKSMKTNNDKILRLIPQ